MEAANTPVSTPISPAAVQAKLAILADAAKYDASCASSGSLRKRAEGGMGNSEGMGICHSYTPDGRCISLLKILLTNFCVYDCKFCINRVSSEVKRARFTPEEVVWLTLEFYRRNYIEGLFLSSGIVDSPDSTMLLLIRAAELLRTTHKFHGYIHLKVVPGASPELIERAGLFADRVSANVELPTQEDLNTLAPAKRISVAGQTMSEIGEKITENKEHLRKFKNTPKFAPAGQTTQMIVGATESTDATYLATSSALYKKYSLRRIYYSAYSPIPHADPSLPVERPHLQRENRLYQSDWLVRFYGFRAEELTTAAEPNLALNLDPKSGWALRQRDFFPVNVNLASREALLRVPGLGLKSVDKILATRKFRQLKLECLGKMGVPMHRAKFFLQTADHNPDLKFLDSSQLRPKLESKKVQPKQQLSLFGNAS